MAVTTIFQCSDGTTHTTRVAAEGHDARWELVQQVESFYQDGEFNSEACADWINANFTQIEREI